MNIMMRILIDADGCPVVDIAVRIAVEFKLECMIICDTSHFFEKPGAQTITVSQGNDSVDFALVNRAKPNDIVITQDYGLAAMCLAKGAIPVDQNGRVYSDANIDALLYERHVAKKIRMSGGRLRGHAKRTAHQDDAFECSLRNLLESE